MTSWRVS
jgi:WhiB family redox-sensing transcriptional regulator